MPNSAAFRAGRIRRFILSCVRLGSLSLVWACAVDPGYSSPPAFYGAYGPVYGPDDPYYGASSWDAWGGGYHGGFYGRGFGGTRAYHGGGHGAARGARGGGGGSHGAPGGHRGR